MIQISRFCLTTLLISFVFNSYGQQEEHKFGKITQSELDLKIYEKDPEAGAVVLFDQGRSKFVHDESGSSAFVINFTRVRRIKIFDKSEYHQADIEIPYYQDGYGKTEKVFNIEAIGYNFENGKLEQSVLNPKNVFTEETNEFWKKKKFAIPNVKEGSIIEYKYELNTPFRFNLPDWEFQSRIPTIYSEYEARLIPFYEYVFLLQGTYKFDYQKSFVYQGIDRQLGSIKFQDYVHQYVLKDVMAFKDESFISSINDYLIKIDFQLSKFHSQTGSSTEIITTWPKLNNSLMKHEKFGKFLSSCKKISEKEILSKMDFSGDNELGKCKKIIEYVKTNISWNGYYGKYATRKAKVFTKDNKGNTAELNLFLTALLQSAGIDAKPILISTRNHGKINTKYPFEHFFNSMIVLVQLEKGQILTDASDPLTPYHTVPANCLNGQGLIVEKDGHSWVRLTNNKPSLINESFNFKLSDDQEFLQGEYVKQATGYDARVLRNSFNNETQKITEHYQSKGYENMELVKSLNFDKIESPYTLGFKADYSIENLGDIILISPFLDFPMKENQLRQEERKYPVDMVYKKKRSYTSRVEIPQGYEVSSIPKDYTADNELIKIHYSSNIEGDFIAIKGSFEFKKSIYEPTQYRKLKSYFSRIVKQFNEQIVLKKT